MHNPSSVRSVWNVCKNLCECNRTHKDRYIRQCFKIRNLVKLLVREQIYFFPLSFYIRLVLRLFRRLFITAILSLSWDVTAVKICVVPGWKVVAYTHTHKHTWTYDIEINHHPHKSNGRYLEAPKNSKIERKIMKIFFCLVGKLSFRRNKSIHLFSTIRIGCHKIHPYHVLLEWHSYIGIIGDSSIGRIYQWCTYFALVSIVFLVCADISMPHFNLYLSN